MSRGTEPSGLQTGEVSREGKNLLKELETILKQNKKFVSDDGKLLKNSIVEAGLRPDPSLLKLLMKNKTVKGVFFVKSGDVFVFDKIKFQKFISNKQFLADSYTSFKNKIGLSDGHDGYLKESNNVVLNWAYKDCVLEGGMTKEEKSKNEIFYNTILAPDEITRLYAPKVFTGFEKWDAEAVKKGKAKKVTEIKDTDNFLVEGNNLLSLHSLKERYAGKIKLIYSDPPYNTPGDANSFTYNSSFNHSTWLTFMKNRLEVCKTLLRDDGFMVIAVDHHELFYLGALADEIFDRDNRVGVISVIIKPEGRQFSNFVSVQNDFMLIYAKDKRCPQAKFNDVVISRQDLKTFTSEDDKGKYKEIKYINYNPIRISGRYKNPNNWFPFYVKPDLSDISLSKKKGYLEIFPIEGGIEKSWQGSSEKAKEFLEQDDLVAKKEGDKVEIYRKRRRGRVLSVWENKKYNSNSNGTKLVEELINEKGVSYPKSLYTLTDLIKITTKDDDIIMDINAGSGTTGHAVLEVNKEDKNSRRFILLEQLKDHIRVIKKRLSKVISSESYTYCELKEWNEKYIQEICKAKTKAEIKKIYKRIKKEAFYRYDVDIDGYDGKDFDALSLDHQKDTLCGCLDANHLYVNYSERDDTRYGITDEEKELTKKFYGK